MDVGHRGMSLHGSGHHVRSAYILVWDCEGAEGRVLGLIKVCQIFGFLNLMIDSPQLC
jgi:hypothetical protein